LKSEGPGSIPIGKGLGGKESLEIDRRSVPYSDKPKILIKLRFNCGLRH
jgi:hypothetical protein